MWRRSWTVLDAEFTNLRAPGFAVFGSSPTSDLSSPTPECGREQPDGSPYLWPPRPRIRRRSRFSTPPDLQRQSHPSFWTFRTRRDRFEIEIAISRPLCSTVLPKHLSDVWRLKCRCSHHQDSSPFIEMTSNDDNPHPDPTASALIHSQTLLLESLRTPLPNSTK